MRVKNENLLDDSGTVDLSANTTLKPVWLGHIAQYAIQLVFTGTPGGNFKLQASNDLGSIDSATGTMQISALANWTDIAGSPVVVAAAGDVMWNAENVGYNWVRVVWTQTSSTGTLTSARAYMKGV